MEIDGKSIENPSKSTKNRRKFHLRRFGTLGTVLETRWDALGTSPGRPKLASGLILERPGRAKSGREPSESVPGPVPRGSRTGPQRCPSVFGVSSAAEHAHGTIVGRFCIGARKLRCVFRISFYSVLLASSDLRHERVRAAKRFENQRVSASKIEPRSVRASQNRARAARFEQQNAQSRAIFLLSARTSQSVRQSERESASCWAGKSANARSPRGPVKEPR